MSQMASVTASTHDETDDGDGVQMFLYAMQVIVQEASLRLVPSAFLGVGEYDVFGLTDKLRNTSLGRRLHCISAQKKLREETLTFRLRIDPAIFSL